MDTKSALTCLVPAVEQIQSIRKQHDTAYSRWMPHFNIDCFPFFPPERHMELATLIQSVCAGFRPITLVLDSIEQFCASKKKIGTLYAAVRDASRGEMKRAHDEILFVLGMDKVNNFTPHVTLGRFDDQEALDAMQDVVSRSWKPLNFVLDGLHLIVRGYDTPFEERIFFPFGKNDYVVLRKGEAPLEPCRPVAAAHVDPMPAVADDFAVRVSRVGEYSVFRVKKNHAASLKKARIMNVLVIDNSGSMGGATIAATTTIGQGMFSLPPDAVDMVPGTVIIFADHATVLSTEVKSPRDVAALQFPSQGQTNITDGIATAMTCILSRDDPSVHYVVTFLSDGGHNCGPRLSNETIASIRKQIDAQGVRLSIIVVGLTANTDTTLGMQVKTGLETVPMNALESVYYAKSTADMTNVIQQLTKGCVDSLCHGTPVDLQVANGVFVENMQPAVQAFLYDGDSVFLVRGREASLVAVAGSCGVQATPAEPCESDVALVVDSMIPKLSQLRIAHGVDGIKKQLDTINSYVDEVEKILVAIEARKTAAGLAVDQIGKVHMSPKERLLMLKKVKQSSTLFKEERNKLRMLCVQVQNNSAEQAAYLTGMKKKYAAKAILKADTLNISPTEALDQVRALKKDLELALAKDRSRIKEADGAPESILSLNNAFDELSQWVATIEKGMDVDFVDMYSLLVAFSFPAYSVQFDQNNAVQMDPFQTFCKTIEPCPVDTAALMLANQMGHKLLSQSREEMTDGLILVNPLAPATTLVAMKSMVYQYLCSVTLCRDLYMYSPKMTFSMHAHAFAKAVPLCFEKGPAYIELALRILYSIRKYWGPRCREGENLELFKHWWESLETITQSEKDGCNHPAQLLLMLGALDLSQLRIPFDNTSFQLQSLLNECLARILKIKLVGVSQRTKDQPDSHFLAITALQRYFGIDASNSPQPDPDVLKPEPPVATVRESCQHWAEVADPHALDEFGVADIERFVEHCTLQYAHTFLFAIGVQRFLIETSRSWDGLVTEMENVGGVVACMVNYLKDFMQRFTGKSVFEIMGAASPKVPLAMFMQAFLHHESQTRVNITQRSVMDSTTLNDMIIDLRMAVYFESCKIKREKWIAVIGDVTYAEALGGDEAAFESMIGVHTHGLNKQRFWAMVKAALPSVVKRHIFESKSNSTVSKCFEKMSRK